MQILFPTFSHHPMRSSKDVRRFFSHWFFKRPSFLISSPAKTSLFPGFSLFTLFVFFQPPNPVFSFNSSFSLLRIDSFLVSAWSPTIHLVANLLFVALFFFQLISTPVHSQFWSCEPLGHLVSWVERFSFPLSEMVWMTRRSLVFSSLTWQLIYTKRPFLPFWGYSCKNLFCIKPLSMGMLIFLLPFLSPALFPSSDYCDIFGISS